MDGLPEMRGAEPLSDSAEAAAGVEAAAAAAAMYRRCR